MLVLDKNFMIKLWFEIVLSELLYGFLKFNKWVVIWWLIGNVVFVRVVVFNGDRLVCFILNFNCFVLCVNIL